MTTTTTVKIDDLPGDLPGATTLADVDQLLVWDEGVAKTITLATLKDYVGDNGGGNGGGERTIADDDINLYVAVLDSADASVRHDDNAAGDRIFNAIQDAIDWVEKHYDLAGHTATVHIADGTYVGFTHRLWVNGVIVVSGTNGKDAVTILGHPAIAEVDLSAVNEVGWTVGAHNGTRLHIAGLRLTTDTNASANQYVVAAARGGKVRIAGSVDFAATNAAHLYAYDGGLIEVWYSAYTISGGGSSHILVAGSGSQFLMRANDDDTIQVSNTPNFSEAFLVVTNNASALFLNCNFGGGATGVRYAAVGGGVIQGATADALPGSQAGLTQNGGVIYP